MTDYISRADAIEAVRIIADKMTEHGKVCMEQAVSILEALPSTVAPKGDLISRQWLLELYGDYIGDNGDPKYHVPLEVVRQNIKDAPSADVIEFDFNKYQPRVRNKVNDGTPSAETHEIRTETHGVCLISKDDAMGAVQDHFNADGFKGYDDGQKMMDRIKALPSANAVDCTDFIEWLVDRVLDETIWENNSVAYGEIICRKLEKLGVLEVTEEPSYYIRPSAEAVQGEWLEIEDYNGDYHYQCSVCKDEFYLEYGTPKENGYAYCPSCGARMVKGGDDE